MMAAPGTVFVVDDNAAVRKSLHTLFSAAGLPVETYASGRQFLAAFDPATRGCLVLDVKLRRESGLDLLEELHRRKASMPVVVLTAHGSVPLSVRAMKAGAIDVVEKPMPPVQLLIRVRDALEVASRRQDVLSAESALVQRATRLTPRERQVAELTVAGKRSKEIAAALGVSYRTVEGYRSRLLEKMEVKSATELVVALLRAGVVPRT
jgi:FixJ family two-component response regulator